MRIVVTRRIPEAALVELRAAGKVWMPEEDRALEPGELRKAVAGADAIVSMLHDRIDASVAEAAGPGLRVVANVAVGYDNIDVPALTGRGVLVTNTPGVLTDATADLAFGLLLALTRRIAEGDRLLRARQPWSFHLGFMLGTGLQAKTLGIVGPGQIGQAMAKRAEAFGMHVVYSGRSDPKEELLRQADVVSLHCPLTAETRHLIDAAALKLMKPSAILINTTRGPVVDESALADALLAREIAGAALDVFEREPAVEPRLLDLDNVVLTPHLGSATVETRTQMALLAAENITAVLAGKEPPNPVHR
ncbi:2-hydroxyacid dehydrogenase [Amycolatopsis alkalitolerans]|uniref:D-glycerate dehydrogenase n=1 Tax=Amycolatopsis alkalitolerans TaxID=2547244 RepID=A0A5C4LTL0_9PSEU|nr:D-glycerate dehydrogenase [Amycolatopsis alkalitolerans]TNC21195.1 D-glycerate dehydrogenase [Amycolatopsis alkalitolerans]